LPDFSWRPSVSFSRFLFPKPPGIPGLYPMFAFLQGSPPTIFFLPAGFPTAVFLEETSLFPHRQFRHPKAVLFPAGRSDLYLAPLWSFPNCLPRRSPYLTVYDFFSHKKTTSFPGPPFFLNPQLFLPPRFFLEKTETSP